MSQRIMPDANGRSALPSQRRMHAPPSATPDRGYARNQDRHVSELPADPVVSQWPLGSQSTNRQFRNPPPINQNNPYRSPAPSRQPPAEVFPYPQSPDSQNFVPSPPMSTHPSRPTSSRASTVSSIGTIPDFPLPQVPLPAAASQRRNQTLGPPPSARRPGPNYFTRESYVSPIVEESVESSPRSAAFTGGVNSNRGSMLNDQYVAPHSHHAVEKGDSDVPQISTRDDARRLIRQASRAQRPEEDPTSSPDPSRLAPETNGNFRFPFASPPMSPLSSEYEPDNERPQLTTLNSFSRSPLLSANGSPEEVPSPYSEKNFGPTHMMSEKVPPSRRPPRLDIDAVREAESRGSLTSLPELIRRATKLAANLDRGKTASRLGMLDMFNSQEKLDDKSTNASITDMIAAFPPPGQTPEPFTSSQPSTNESYLEKHGNLAQKKRGRRCCGMSLCVFMLLCTVLVLLIAAAVLVPVFLIVIPNLHQAQHNAAAQAALSSCSTDLPCSNAGISVVSDNACQCICVDGFTGSQCTTASDPGCTTTDIMSGALTISNATVGASLPRLLTGSKSNFSIPLNSTALLSLFSANSLSCTCEDSLVTFNQQGSKSKRFYIVPNERPPLISANHHSPAPTARAEVAVPLKERSNTVATSAGIVFQQSTTKTSAATSIAASAPSSTPTPASSAAGTVSQDTQDFAAIAVLFVLEKTNDLDSAIKAQQSILNLFLSSNMTSTLDLSYTNFDVIANFGTFGLHFANGTILGGRGNGNGSLT